MLRIRVAPGLALFNHLQIKACKQRMAATGKQKDRILRQRLHCHWRFSGAAAGRDLWILTYKPSCDAVSMLTTTDIPGRSRSLSACSSSTVIRTGTR